MTVQEGLERMDEWMYRTRWQKRIYKECLNLVMRVPIVSCKCLILLGSQGPKAMLSKIRVSPIT